MRLKFRKSFRKDYKKLSIRQQAAWLKALRLLQENATHAKLRRHKLAGKYSELESIDVLPDLRAVFLEDGDWIVFYYIRNHNQLYG